MVLLRALLGEAEVRRRRLHERAPDARASRRRPLLTLRTLEHPHELVVLDVPGRSDDHVAACIHLPVVCREDALRDGRDHVRGADHGPAERVASEDGLGEEVVNELLRRVLVHRDLLQDDLSLGVEIREARCEDHVGHHVEGGLHVRIGDARIDHGVLARGCGVQLAAQPVEDLGYLLRRVAAGALEQEVFEEVRGARLGVGLIP